MCSEVVLYSMSLPIPPELRQNKVKYPSMEQTFITRCDDRTLDRQVPAEGVHQEACTVGNP